MKTCLRLVLIISLINVSLTSFANEIELPYLIGDGMVVQRGEAIPVWGWAPAGTAIEVSFGDKTITTTSNENSEWQVLFPKRKAGGPYVLNIKGASENYSFKDIWVGDVWVLSGQSNMEWPLRSANNAEAEIAKATDKHIRHFKIPRSWASSPQQRLQGGDWQVSSPETAAAFSAVGYFFAANVRKEIDIPIGLINSTWGGSNIESWMDAPLLGLDRDANKKKLDSLESQEEIETEAVRKKVSRWQNALTDNYESAQADWSAAKLDESDWVSLNAPALWEATEFMGLDGVAWYRLSFNLSKEEAAHDAELGLARIDDDDLTWVNGKKVGETHAYDAVRKYKVSKTLLHAGTNTIAIRVTDTGGGGGIYSDPDLLYLRGVSVNKSLAGSWKFKVDKGSVSLSGDRNYTPTALYNKMMHPLFKVPVKGVLWYQGESNANEAEQALAYRKQFKDLILDWRKSWDNKKLPFYWVQLANFNSGRDSKGKSPWAIVRESQTDALTLPHTGQAITIDVGNPKDIHPRDKQTVGKRLALLALKNDYGKSNTNARGPYIKKAKIKASTVLLTMASNAGLRLAEGTNELQGFEIADENGHWHPAKATIERNNITLSSDKVSTPTAARYAWSDNPENVNLVDNSGLPAEPFRVEHL